MSYEKRALALVNVSTVTNEVHHEQMLFLVRRVNNSITPYAELVESSQFTCEFVGRKIIEILRQPFQLTQDALGNWFIKAT